MENLQEKTDAQLVILSLKDSSNFAQLVERYEKKLFRYVRRLSGLTNESAEDVLQEAFIKMYSNLNDFDQTLSFSSWAYRITHNETINYLRKNTKVKTVSLENDDESEASLIDVLKSEIDLEDEMLKKDLGERVQAAMQMLPGKYKEALILRYLQELDYKDISDILKIPMGTVATLINRAKSKFKDIAIKQNLKSLIKDDE